MRWLLLICALVLPVAASSQSKDVLPSDLELRVEVEQTDHMPFTREMVLITIHGVYRRHITRESLVQPKLDGFSWTQLGGDMWRDTRINGVKVKTFRRRMALYPDRPGRLTIGAFTHNLTLTDEGDDWFDHQIQSDPVTIEVVPAPTDQDWWFPTRFLKVSDEWSNAPDQLKPGEGVLRVVRIEALGATPEMIPPMPTLTSPSGKIFPHPEKRFVELSPQGPHAFAFWRWTIQPGNDTSAIVEPLRFTYFDTINRVEREVVISAQRIAYGTVVPDSTQTPDTPAYPSPAALPGWPMFLTAMAICTVGIVLAIRGHQITGWRALRRISLFDPLARALRRAARRGQTAKVRQHAASLLRRDGDDARRTAMVHALDRSLFDPAAQPVSLPEFARSFLRRS